MILETFGTLRRIGICLKDHNAISSNLIVKEGQETPRENIQDHLTAGFDEKLKPKSLSESERQVIKPCHQISHLLFKPQEATGEL